MKLTELKCTACNGTLKLDEQTPHIAVCEYCKTRYLLEDEGEGNVRLASEQARINYAPSRQTYTPAPKSTLPNSAAPKASGWQPYGWKRGVALAVVVLLVLAAAFGPGIKKRWDMDHGKADRPVIAEQPDGSGEETTAVEEEKAELTGIFADTAAMAMGKRADSLTEEELARFQWLEYKYTMDNVMVGYSFENPVKQPEAALTWLEFDRDKAKLNLEALTRFTQLKALGVAGYVSADDIKGLDLERLSCYCKTPGEAASLFETPEQLKELHIPSGLENLDGLGAFTGLEKLTIGGSDLTDIKALANLKGLRSLTLEYCDEVKDFSVLSVMDWLEELSIESEGVKDIGFVKHMPGLASLSLDGAQILNLDSLKDNTSLKALSLTDCDEVSDLSAIEALIGLEELTLEVPYNCPQPTLSSLTALKKLSVDGMDTVRYLAGMQALEELNLEWVTIDSPASFTSLKNLKKLTCSRIPDDTSWAFAAGIPGLEVLDLNGVATYEDISGLFAIPTLRELYLNGVECELDFSKLTPNENLQTLEMDGVKLCKNVKISGGGGIVYVDYDTVSLDDHTDFLTNYPGLKNLSLSDNMLTHLTFAPTLRALERLNISENYITDIKPLEGLSKLKFLNASGNPIENYRVISEDVAVIQ